MFYVSLCAFVLGTEESEVPKDSNSLLPFNPIENLIKSPKTLETPAFFRIFVGETKTNKYNTHLI